MSHSLRPKTRSSICCVTAAYLALWVCPQTIKAQQRSQEVGSAVDAQGVRYVAKGHAGQPPWFADMVRKRRPDYPYSETSMHHEGSGFFRLTIDLKTGEVTNIAMIQSTGFPKLDEAAIKTLRDWRWKPGKWKQVDVPITYTMSPPRQPEASSVARGAPEH